MNNKGFTKVFNNVLEMELSHSALKTFLAISVHARTGEWKLHKNFIAKEYNMSINTVCAAIDELTSKNLIIAKKGESQCNAWTFSVVNPVPNTKSENTQNYTRFYNEILKLDLTHTALRTYLALTASCADTNTCHVHQNKIAARFKISLSSVNRAVQELKKAGLIVMEKTIRAFDTCKYTLKSIVANTVNKLKEINNERKEKSRVKAASTFKLPNGEVITLAAPVAFGGDYNLVEEVKKEVKIIEEVKETVEDEPFNIQEVLDAFGF